MEHDNATLEGQKTLLTVGQRERTIINIETKTRCQ